MKKIYVFIILSSFLFSSIFAYFFMSYNRTPMSFQANSALVTKIPVCSFIKVQKYIDDQWNLNHQLLDNASILKMDPHIYLYTAMSLEDLESLTNQLQELSKRIDFNEKLQQQLTQITLSSIHLDDLSLQNIQLRITFALTQSLILRGQHNLKNAMSQLDKCFDLIATYQKTCHTKSLKGFVTPDTFLALAYYHKGKIHRVAAGLDQDNLNRHYLVECEKSYLSALDLKPNCAAIYGSLGFLYDDMSLREKSLHYFELAHQIEPKHPTYMHGIAVNYYFLARDAKKQGSYNSHHVIIAEESFKQAIQLYNESSIPSGRVYLDYGNLQVFMEHTEEALVQFDDGLKIQPNHSLLLMARGVLLGKFGRTEEGIKDLKRGLILARNNALEKKYSRALEQIQNTPQSVENNVAKNHGNSTSLLCNQNDNRESLEVFFKKCADYTQSKNKSKKRPTCFISYAWGIPEQEQWILQFAEDLEKAGIEVLLDRWCIAVGEDLMGHVEKMLLDDTDFILVIGTKQFLKKSQFVSNNADELERVSRVETRVINYMVRFNTLTSNKIIPILLEGTATESLPPMVRMKVTVDFTEGSYSATMYRLIRGIHKIHSRDKVFLNLKNKL